MTNGGESVRADTPPAGHLPSAVSVRDNSPSGALERGPRRGPDQQPRLTFLTKDGGSKVMTTKRRWFGNDRAVGRGASGGATGEHGSVRAGGCARRTRALRVPEAGPHRHEQRGEHAAARRTARAVPSPGARIRKRAPGAVERLAGDDRAVRGSYDTIARFIGAPGRASIALYRNTTEAHNAVMYSLLSEFRNGDNVVTTTMTQLDAPVPSSSAATGALELPRHQEPAANYPRARKRSELRQPSGERRTHVLIDGAQLVPGSSSTFKTLTWNTCRFRFTRCWRRSGSACCTPSSICWRPRCRSFTAAT